MAVNALPIILYRSIYETSIANDPTATSEAAGFPVTNIKDGRSYTKWKATSSADQNIDINTGTGGGPFTVTSLAIIGHNMGTAGTTLTIEQDNSPGFSGGETLLHTVSPTNDDPFYNELDVSGSQQFYRLNLDSNSVAPEIGYIILGAKTTMEVGPQYGAAFHNFNAKGESFVSETGQHLGSALQFQERTINHKFKALTRSFLESDLLPFLYDHYGQFKPFFYVPDTANLTTDVYFLRAPNNVKISLPTMGAVRDRHNWTLNGVGVKNSSFLT